MVVGFSFLIVLGHCAHPPIPLVAFTAPREVRHSGSTEGRPQTPAQGLRNIGNGVHNGLGDHRRRPLGNPVPNRGPTMADMGYQPGNKRVKPCGESLGKGPRNLPVPILQARSVRHLEWAQPVLGSKRPRRLHGPKTKALLHGAGPSDQWGLTTRGTPEYRGPTKPRGLSHDSRRGLRALYLQTRGLYQMKSQIKH